MTGPRRCSRTACTQGAVATFSYAYGEQRVVVGALAPEREPHYYDLCAHHAAALSAPRGWELVREIAPAVVVLPAGDDLEALADAVREAARTTRDAGAAVHRGHLRMLRAPG